MPGLYQTKGPDMKGISRITYITYGTYTPIPKEDWAMVYL